MDDVPLREYVEALFAQRDKGVEAALASAEKAVEAALAAAEKATDKAELAQRVHDTGANEFRQQLKDQVATFPTRRELQTVVDQLSKVEKAVSNLEGRALILATSAGVVGAVVGGLVAKLVS